MQLLRDNLTLWTSSDGGEPEPAPPGDATAKDAEKTAAPTEPREPEAAPSEPKAEETTRAQES